MKYVFGLVLFFIVVFISSEEVLIIDSATTYYSSNVLILNNTHTYIKVVEGYNTATFDIPYKDGFYFNGFSDSNGVLFIDSEGNLQPNIDNFTDSNGNWIGSSTLTLFTRFSDSSISEDDLIFDKDDLILEEEVTDEVLEDVGEVEEDVVVNEEIKTEVEDKNEVEEKEKNNFLDIFLDILSAIAIFAIICFIVYLMLDLRRIRFE